MNKVVLVESTKAKTEDGLELILAYYITEEICKMTKRYMYGIKVVCDKNGILESDSTGSISYSREDVIKMCRILVNQQVTPISLVEIVDELITLKSEEEEFLATPQLVFV